MNSRSSVIVLRGTRAGCSSYSRMTADRCHHLNRGPSVRLPGGRSPRGTERTRGRRRGLPAPSLRSGSQSTTTERLTSGLFTPCGVVSRAGFQSRVGFGFHGSVKPPRGRAQTRPFVSYPASVINDQLGGSILAIICIPNKTFHVFVNGHKRTH